jgi:hypothetical protein
MVHSKMYKGIEYVQLDELPLEQKERIQGTLNKELFIKILINGQVLPNCIQYKNYRNWFENVYSVKADLSKIVSAKPVAAN